MLRSRHTLPLAILMIVIGGICAATAFGIDWLPDRAAEQASRVDHLLWFVVGTSLVIFTIVMSFLLYSAWRFRVSEDDDEDGPPTHGNTTLEVVWTAIPVVLLAIVATWAYLVLSDNEAVASDRTVVDVTAEQFAWTFSYPEAGVATGDLHVPVGRQVELKMRSKDVIHDFYVAEFRVKQDVVPGITTRLLFNPNRVGTYQVICAELCGVGHGVMRARVIVMEPSDYQSWLASAQRQVAAQAGGQQGNASATAAGAGTTTDGQQP